jgi:hypothetical protein
VRDATGNGRLTAPCGCDILQPSPDWQGEMQLDQLRRRDFITVLGGAAACPLAARAQQAMPAIGFLASQLPDAITDRLRGFRQGLKDTGYVEGENAAIVYRFAENQDDRLPTLAAELVSRPVAWRGCALTRPSRAGSSPTRKTMGTVVVAALAANVGGAPAVAITLQYRVSPQARPARWARNRQQW